MQLMSPKFTSPFNARAVLHDHLVDKIADSICLNTSSRSLSSVHKSGQRGTVDSMSYGEFEWERLIESLTYGHPDLTGVYSTDRVCDIVVSRDNDCMSPAAFIEVKTVSKSSNAHQSVLKRIKCQNSDGSIGRTDWKALAGAYRDHGQVYRIHNSIGSYLSEAMSGLGRQIYLNKLMKLCLEMSRCHLGLIYIFAFTNQDSPIVHPMACDDVAQKATFMMVKVQSSALDERTPSYVHYRAKKIERMRDYFDIGRSDDRNAMSFMQAYIRDCTHDAKYLYEFSRPLMFDGIQELSEFLKTADMDDLLQSESWDNDRILIHPNGILKFSATQRKTCSGKYLVGAR